MPLRTYFPLFRTTRTLSLSTRWAGTLALVGVAFAIRYALYGVSAELPFLMFLPAVILSAVIFNRGTGLLATGASAVLATYFFLPPFYSFAIDSRAGILDLLLFCAVGLFIALVTESLHSAYFEAEQLREKADAARAEAEAGKRQRELLLAEFRHRVANDLQRIAWLAEIDALGAGPEAAGLLRATAGRVHVLARIHEKLAQHDGKVEVEACVFLHDLVAKVQEALTGTRALGLFVECEPHQMSLTRAGSVGLITNELITNAIKHAFPDDRAGSITVRFYQDKQDFLLEVEDDGVGMGPLVPAPEGSSRGRGRGLIRSLAAQLGGRIETAPRAAGGTRHTLRFPVTQPGDQDA